MGCGASAGAAAGLEGVLGDTVQEDLGGGDTQGVCVCGWVVAQSAERAATDTFCARRARDMLREVIERALEREQGEPN